MTGDDSRRPVFLVAAPAARVAELAGTLRRAGAYVVEAPVVSTVPVEDTSELDGALLDRLPYDWVVFTSARGVQAVRDRLAVLSGSPSKLATKVAAVGPSTAQAAVAAGFPPAAVPDEFVTDAIADALGDVRGLRLLLPRADLARRSLADALAEAGATVVSVDSYRTAPAPWRPEPQDVGSAGAVVFTSASGVEFLRAAVAPDAWDGLAGRAICCCIGPVTAEAARRAGFKDVRAAAPHTAAGLSELLKEVVASLA